MQSFSTQRALTASSTSISPTTSMFVGSRMSTTEMMLLLSGKTNACRVSGSNETKSASPPPYPKL